MSTFHHLETQIREKLSVINNFKGLATKELEIEKSNLKVNPFQVKLDDSPPFMAIDGSQTWLWSLMGINIWLMLTRIGVVQYEFRDQQFHLNQKDMFDNVELVSTLEEVISTQSEIHQKLHEYIQHNGRGRERDIIAGALMRLTEHKIAFEIAQTHRNMIIALDGALTTSFPEELLLNEKLPSIADIILTCEKNNNILIGVSKDSRTHYLSKYLTDETFIHYATEGKSERAYVKIDKPIENELGDMYFVKLHPNAPKWFRIDLGNPRNNPGKVFEIIANYARNQILIGYPFPLAEAHKVAVTIRQFRNLHEQLLFDIGPLCGFNLNEILNGFTNVEGRRKSAFHEYLDFVSKLSK